METASLDLDSPCSGLTPLAYSLLVFLLAWSSVSFPPALLSDHGGFVPRSLLAKPVHCWTFATLTVFSYVCRIPSLTTVFLKSHLLICMYVCAHMCLCTCWGEHLEVRGQPVGVSSLCPPPSSRVLTSGCQTYSSKCLCLLSHDSFDYNF